MFQPPASPSDPSLLCVRRVRKLKETLVTVQQLDKNMSNLRTWLSRIEAELAKPVVYSVCHSDEIQKQLAEQQVGTPSDGIQRHSASCRPLHCFYRYSQTARGLEKLN